MDTLIEEHLIDLGDEGGEGASGYTAGRRAGAMRGKRQKGACRTTGIIGIGGGGGDTGVDGDSSPRFGYHSLYFYY